MIDLFISRSQRFGCRFTVASRTTASHNGHDSVPQVFQLQGETENGAPLFRPIRRPDIDTGTTNTENGIWDRCWGTWTSRDPGEEIPRAIRVALDISCLRYQLWFFKWCSIGSTRFKGFGVPWLRGLEFVTVTPTGLGCWYEHKLVGSSQDCELQKFCGIGCGCGPENNWEWQA